MHVFLEYIPLIVFLIVYKLEGIYWATGALIVASALQILFYIIKKKPIPKQTIVFFILILSFGGLTIFLQDDSFIKWKVTIINLFFAGALLAGHYLFNKIILKTFLGEAVDLPDEIWIKLTWAWASFFTLCAVLNWYIAFNFSQETWVNFKVFGLTGLTFVFAIGTVFSLYKHLPEEDEANAPKESEQAEK